MTLCSRPVIRARSSGWAGRCGRGSSHRMFAGGPQSEVRLADAADRSPVAADQASRSRLDRDRDLIAEGPMEPGIPFTTFSLVGRCARTGMLGVAIATSEMA